MKTTVQRELTNMFWVITGVVLFSIAYRWFLFPAGLYSGGFTGISQLLKLVLTELCGVRVSDNIDLTGIIFWCINIPLFGLGYKSIGKKFLLRTLVAVCIQSLLISFLPAPKGLLVDDMLLNCIIGGLLSGVGVGITLRAGGSGGGTDIVGMHCSKEYPNFGVGKISIIINAFIYLITALRYDFEVVAYSMVFSFVAGMMVDRVHDQNIKVSLIIVTKSACLGELMNLHISRGVTSWNGWGEHSHSEKNIHMVVVNKYELQSLRRLIRKEDPDAFIQVMSPNMVIGNFEKRLEVL